MSQDDPMRCFWCGSDPLYVTYHDEEWGVPAHDDRELFERLVLEGFQAGLSWRTILYKRESFRRAFAGFEIEQVAGFGAQECDALLADASIVRNRLKVHAAVQNARAALRLIEKYGSLDTYLWGFVGGRTLLPAHPMTRERLQSSSAEAEVMSAALRRNGFTFVGPTICYAFMQSVGMVDDHLVGCFKYQGPLP